VHKGLWGVGGAVLLSLGIAPTLALADDPIGGVPVPSVSVPSLPVPTPTVPDVPTPPVPDPGGGGGGGDGGSGGSPDSDSVGDVVDAVTGQGSGSGSDAGGSVGSASELPATPSAASNSGGSPTTSGNRRDGSSASSEPNPRSRATSFAVRPARFKARRRDDANRGATLVFRLTRASLVRFTIFEIAPGCEWEGSFTRAGRKGLNRIDFSGRLHGEPLPPGTYRVVVRPVGGNLKGSAERSTFAIVPPRGSPHETALQPSTCGPTAAGGDSGAAGGIASQSGTVGNGGLGEGHSEPSTVVASGTASESEDEDEPLGGVADEGPSTAERPVYLHALLGVLAALALFGLVMGARELRLRFR
jgi:hypothetical protein